MQINILEYFEKSVESYKDKVAIIDGERQISFQELSVKSKIMSGYIAKATNDIIRKPIAVFLPKSIENVIANIGIIYSGNAYMNLDIKTPLARIHNILECIKPEIVITNTEYLKSVSEIYPVEKCIVIDNISFNEDIISEDEIKAKLWPIIDTDPLCVINTSGSTGTPKGVVLNHKSFIDFTDWANEVYGKRNYGLFVSYSF